MSFSTGDVRMSIKNEKEITLGEIVTEADTISRKSRSRKLKFGNIEAADSLMAELRKEHPEFCKSYPIVLRYMCQMQEYSTRAFRQYLLKIKEHPWKTQEEYLDSQADYVVILYRATHTRWNQTVCENIRKNIRTMLQNEHDTFTKYAKEFDREVTEEEIELKKRTEEEMRKFYADYGTEALDVPIVMQSDISISDNVDIDSLTKDVVYDSTALGSSYLDD